MSISPDSISDQNGPDRYGSQLTSGYRSRNGEVSTEPHNGVAAGYEPAGAEKPRLPSLDLQEPPDPMFPSGNWLDEESGSLADHPLLRGLLLELPPRGSTPPPGWLDRWFEATRSILELLYVEDNHRRGQGI